MHDSSLCCSKGRCLSPEQKEASNPYVPDRLDRYVYCARKNTFIEHDRPDLGMQHTLPSSTHEDLWWARVHHLTWKGMKVFSEHALWEPCEY